MADVFLDGLAAGNRDMDGGGNEFRHDPNASGPNYPDSMSTVEMRRAAPDDISQLMAWDQDPAVVHASGEEDDWDWAEEISFPWQEVWIGEVDHRPVGVLVLLDAHAEPTKYWGVVSPQTAAIDIWIGSEADRGHGYGAQMMQWAVTRAHAEWGARRIVIDPLVSNTHAIRFYKSCGFTEVGERFFGPDHCLVLEHLAPVPSTDTEPQGE